MLKEFCYIIDLRSVHSKHSNRFQVTYVGTVLYCVAWTDRALCSDTVCVCASPVSPEVLSLSGADPDLGHSHIIWIYQHSRGLGARWRHYRLLDTKRIQPPIN